MKKTDLILIKKKSSKSKTSITVKWSNLNNQWSISTRILRSDWKNN